MVTDPEIAQLMLLLTWTSPRLISVHATSTFALLLVVNVLAFVEFPMLSMPLTVSVLLLFSVVFPTVKVLAIATVGLTLLSIATVSETVFPMLLDAQFDAVFQFPEVLMVAVCAIDVVKDTIAIASVKSVVEMLVVFIKVLISCLAFCNNPATGYPNNQ